MGDTNDISIAGAEPEAADDGAERLLVENERIDAFISDLAKRLAAQPRSARDWRQA